DNSLDAFSNKENNTITIKLELINDKKILTYEDTAGGIKIKPIEKVFEYFITSKNEKEGKGIGLALAKMLITDRLDGTITAKNNNLGVEFKIIF
ncbi:ATP-binding protein, partial [Poseidonibacter antarcticus]|uniref:ATP-binding protein n=1 Tax=Poseidonibacter antarcticus TaxID=2478538 RepID=UPI0013CEBB91